MDAILGRDHATGSRVSLPTSERESGLYVIGRTGTGKTGLMVNLILQDIERGHGVCFIDPHGDATRDVLERLPGRAEDVILLDAADRRHRFGINFYEVPDPSDDVEVARRAGQAVDVFRKVWGEGPTASWGPRLANLLGTISYTLIANPGMTMAEIPLLLADGAFRERLVINVADPDIRRFWSQYDQLSPATREERTESTLNKVREFLQNPLIRSIVGQSHSTIDFRQAMDERKIVLVKLASGELGEAPVSLLGSMMVGLIANAALSRVDIPQSQRHTFFLFADEYQLFATPTFARLLTETRKYGVGTTVAHQFRDQFERGDANRGATLTAANLVVFGISGQDAEELAKQFSTPTPPVEATGVQAIRAVSQSPVQHLRDNTHRNPAVRAVVGGFIAPLLFDAEQPWQDDTTVYYHEIAPRDVYVTRKESVRTGVLALNNYLVAMMDGRVKPGSEDEGRHLAAIFIPLRGYIRFASEGQYQPPEFVLDNRSEFFGRTVPGQFILFPLSAHAVSALHDLFTAMAATFATRADAIARIVDMVHGSERYAQVLESSGLSHVAWTTSQFEKPTDWLSALGSCSTAKWAVTRARTERDPVRAQTLKQESEEAPIRAQRRYPGYFTPLWNVFTGRAGRYSGSEYSPEIECRSLITWAHAVLTLARLLAEDPIHVTSGQWEPTYEPRRTVADVEREFAKSLATLPKWEAWCRISHGRTVSEHHIETLELPPTLSPDEQSVRYEHVLAHTHQQYCRLRSAVDEEITQRQEARVTRDTGLVPPRRRGA